MKSKQLLFIAALIMALALSACGGTPGPSLPDEISDAVLDDDILDLAPLPQCNGDFDPPEPVSPINFEIVDPDAPYHFKWLMLNCQPEWYDLKVFYSPHTQGPTVVNDDFMTTSMSWDVNTPLEPLTTYEWRVIAVSWESDGNWFASDWNSFTTGPVCGPDDMVAPTLIYPADGSTYTGKSWGNPFEVEADISYPNDTCTPEVFNIYISETEDFSTPNLNIFSPGARFSRHLGEFLLIEDDSNDVPDCTMLYWKAWGAVGDTAGPESEVFSFYTNIEGTCFIAPDFDDVEFEFPFDVPYIMASQNVNCRASDYSASKNLGTLLEGEAVAVLAVNPEATHVRIMEPSFNVSCWVWLGVVDLMYDDLPFDPDMLVDMISLEDPAEPAPPTPTDTPPTDTPAPAQCSDGIDNDNDGATDYGDLAAIAAGTADRECSSPDDDSEAN